MKVIVCGAGQVGYNIARYLAAAGNDVTAIDQRAELTQKIGESLDIQAITGFAAHPEVLEQAGAEDAEMLIAVTSADEVNMVTCQVAHSLFNVPMKIARVRHQSYLQNRWRDLFRREHMPIDVIISPELEVARAIIAPPRGAGRDRRHVVRRGPGAADRRALRARLPGPRHALAPADLPVPRPAHDDRRHRARRPLLRAERRRPSDRRRRGLLGGRDQPRVARDAGARPRGGRGRAHRDLGRRQHRAVPRQRPRGRAGRT